MSPKEKLKNARNFTVFYGINMERELSMFDIIIVEPAGQASSTVRKLKESGKLVLAYLSAVEVSESSEEFKQLKREDFIRVKEKILVNASYGTYMADLRSKRWRNILFHSAGRLIKLDDYDGLFIDTIGNVELPQIPDNVQNELYQAAQSLLLQFKSIDEERVILQNNGLNTLCMLTAGIIDGICWENPDFISKRNMDWSRKILSRLQFFKKVGNIQVFLITEDDETGNPSGNHQRAYAAALKNDFLYYRAPYQYIKGIHLP